jgi:hypothetical protein
VPAGTIAIGWVLEAGAPGDRAGDASRLRLSWIERDGPAVLPPPRKGFGHMVIEGMTARSLNGNVSLEFAPDGLKWMVVMPSTHLIAEGREQR